MVKKIITQQGREALRNYKYVASSKSKSDLLMNPYWEWVVSFMPYWLAPNLITFTATIQYILSVALFEYYYEKLNDNDINHSHTNDVCLPQWIYIWLAISMFIYQTLDAIDGKQARRTKTSSPLGQLFDHGNDALAYTFMLLSAIDTVGITSDWQAVIWLLCGYIVFYMVNWRARHEGQMFFGIFSVTEAQFLAMGTYLITAFAGCQMWKYEIFGVSISVAITMFTGVLAVGTVFAEFMAVEKYYKLSKKEDPGRWIELSQITLFVLTAVCWNLVGIFRMHKIMFILICCLIFSGMVHRLIINDVTHMKTKAFPMLLALQPFILIFSLLEYNNIKVINISMTSTIVVYGIFIYEFICWISYVLTVINEICNSLDINLFVIDNNQESTKKH